VAVDPWNAVKAGVGNLADWIHRKRRVRNAFRQCFLDANGKLSPAGTIVIAELSRRARVTSTIVVRDGTGAIDTHASFLAEGRRELFNTVVLFLNIDDSDLYRAEQTERNQSARQPENRYD
jgi:hypothetical protein